MSAFISVETSVNYSGGSKNYSVSVDHLFDAFVENIIGNNAPLILILITFPAGNASPDFFTGELHHLGPDPCFSSSLNTVLTRIAVLPSFLALPLNATTFIFPPFNEYYSG